MRYVLKVAYLIACYEAITAHVGIPAALLTVGTITLFTAFLEAVIKSSEKT